MRYAASVFAALTFACGSAQAQTTVDPSLRIQKWVSGLANPTSMAFLPDDTGLILEKDTGKVEVMRNKSIAGTAIDLPVANNSEEGLLGIAVSPTFASDHFVYLYYTASSKDGGSPIANCVKRYTFDGSTLTFNKKIIDLPATPGPNHNAGKMVFGADGKLYIFAGELNRNELTTNHSKGNILDPVASILRLNPSGTAPPSNPFYSPKNTGEKKALNEIFAYGMRNSFGMDVDPVSKTLWETENGPTSWDEINRITPGFNGGWETIQGPVDRVSSDPSKTIAGLVSLGPAAHYGDPKFSWATPVAPTDAMFMSTSRLGGQYKDDLFVATYHGGKILDFDLSPSRKTLALTGDLADDVADNTTSDLFKEQSSITFAQGFGTITDLTVGPGGMYALDYTNGELYRITTQGAVVASADSAGGELGAIDFDELSRVVPEPQLISIMMVTLLAGCRRTREFQ